MSKFTKKCMAIRTLSDTASGCHTFLCKFWRFKIAVSQWKLAWLTPNLGILWISVCCFWLCESIVAYPLIYRLVPRPSRFEIRQCAKQNIFQLWCENNPGLTILLADLVKLYLRNNFMFWLDYRALNLGTLFKVDGTSFSDAGSLVTTALLTREICPREYVWNRTITRLLEGILFICGPRSIICARAERGCKWCYEGHK